MTEHEKPKISSHALVCHPAIAWARIGRAVDFYVSRGFEYIEVPWVVPREVTKLTLPSGAVPIETSVNEWDLVGSAEQGFLFRERLLRLFPGDYVAVTPCFRHEQDAEHHLYFMKVELYSQHGPYFHSLMKVAGEFFALEGALVKSVSTDRGLDWFVGGLEVGSYGINRQTGGNPTVWAYGTGLAEPRFSTALKRQDEGEWL